VRLAFLDYSHAAQRLAYCREEVRLNRRLAPDIYRGVRGLAPSGPGLTLTGADDPGAIDYLVEMRRFDERRTLAGLLRSAGSGGDDRIDAVAIARRLVEFHADCPVWPGGRSSLPGEAVTDNLRELIAVADDAELEPLAGLAGLMLRLLRERADYFARRVQDGHVREGHGDLRAEHVVLERDLRIVDCLEFDRRLRTLDTADDLAFLIMDLVALGAEALAERLVSEYRAAGGDCGPDWLLGFYGVHRALVRVKVLLVRAAQQHKDRPGREQTLAAGRALLAVAHRFAWRARLPAVLVVCGLPASGKSHLARRLASLGGGVWVSSDRVRKELAGVPAAQRAPASAYRPEVSRDTYRELGRRAAQTLGAQRRVIVDATFRHRDDRAAFSAACDAAAVFVECVAPAAVREARAAGRQQDPQAVSDATVAVVGDEALSWAPLDELDARRHVIVRTDRPVEAALADLSAALEQRLGEADLAEAD
jgi:hypothetical protein